MPSPYGTYVNRYIECSEATDWCCLFTYANGQLYWRKSPSRKFKRGARAGTRCKRGYVWVCVLGVKHSAHKVIYEMHNGPVPDGYFIDHIDGDPSNNIASNLRLADPSQNRQNSKRPSTNTSGFKGVSRFKKKWKASITIEGRHIDLGTFNEPEAAFSAYCSAANLHYGDFARTE